MKINIEIEVNAYTEHVPKEVSSKSNWEMLRAELEDSLDETLGDVLAKYDIVVDRDSLNIVEFDTQGESKDEY